MFRLLRGTRFAVILVLATSTSGVALEASSTAAGTTNVVLGSAAFAAPNGEGWGTVRPTKIFNGGDPSGLVNEIFWTSWGGRTAIGFGLHAIFKPRGGYYSQPVLIELRAFHLGRCSSGGPSAYTQLSVRGPERPGGPFGTWHSWSGASSLCKFGF